MVAKIASDFQKPDGLTVVTPEEAEDFLAPLAVRKIPGIGPKTEQSLARLGIKTVKDLKRFTPEELYEKFGKWGPSLYERIRGRHDSPLVTEWEPKSVGEQETFAQDTRDLEFIFSAPLGPVPGGASAPYRRRLSHLPHRGGDGALRRFRDLSRSHTLPHPAASLRTLTFHAMKLLMPFLDRRENPKTNSSASSGCGWRSWGRMERQGFWGEGQGFQSLPSPQAPLPTRIRDRGRRGLRPRPSPVVNFRLERMSALRRTHGALRKSNGRHGGLPH